MIFINLNDNISGFKNEYDICNKLNNKKVYELNPMYRAFIEDLYRNVNENDILKCVVDHTKKKYDIIIEKNKIKKKISIKKGIKNSVHVEGISSFINFLIENNISRNSVIGYLKYHYADGTTNGSGINRLSANEYKQTHQEEIDNLNKELNKKQILLKAIYRFVIGGKMSDKNIDAIIFGTKNDFLWIKKEDIINIILSKKDVYSTGVHFGPLSIQPMDRCLNHNEKYEKKRFCVQVKWYNLADDIIECMNNKIKDTIKD